MAEFIVTAPDGSKYRITGQGTGEEAMRALQKRLADPEATEFLRSQREAELPQPFPTGPSGESVAPRTQPTASEFAGRGIATGLGFPADAANAALGLVGLESERPFLGSARIADTMRNVAPVAGEFETPETVAQSAAEGMGLAGGSLLPGGGLTGAAIKFGGPATRRVGREIGRTFLERPIRATALELAAGAGAGAGGRLAEDRARDTGQNTAAARIVGELVGGLTTVVAPGAALPATLGLVRGTIAVGKRIPGISLAANLLDNAGRAVHQRFTRGGAFTRASRRLRDESGDPGADAALITAEGGVSGQTPATQTGNPRLMALERAVLDADATLDREFAAHGRRKARKRSGRRCASPQAMRWPGILGHSFRASGTI